MTGETDLQKLLKTLEPTINDTEFVFCTLATQEVASMKLQPICLFKEDEGLTIVCSKEEAQASGFEYSFPCKMITLTVHSSLEAVGLTAAIAKKLAGAGISANVIAAYYHDHVFVPIDRAEEAIALLKEFSR